MPKNTPRPKSHLKLFVIRKYVFAKSARAAIKAERKHEVDDVWIDDDWRKDPKNQLSSAIGFTADDPEY
jgi:hypothetical protein